VNREKKNNGNGNKREGDEEEEEAGKRRKPRFRANDATLPLIINSLDACNRSFSFAQATPPSAASLSNRRISPDRTDGFELRDSEK
jgi:hypothetical protein